MFGHFNDDVANFKNGMQDCLSQLQSNLASSFANEDELLIETESRYHLAKLRALVEADINIPASATDHNGNKESILSDILFQYKHFLADRWDQIQKTDASYLCQLNTPINKACLYLAEQLAAVLKGHAYEYLMPSLRLSHYACMRNGERVPFSSLRLNEIVLSDDGEPMSITSILDAARWAKKDKLTYEVYRDNELISRTISQAEERRIKEHSEYTKKYFDAITQAANAVEPLSEDAEVVQAYYAIAGHDDYPVSVHYHESAAQLLKVLCVDIKSGYDLADFLAHYVDANKWQAFLGLLNNDMFAAFMLGFDPATTRRANLDEQSYKAAWLNDCNMRFANVIAHQPNFQNNQDAFRAYSLCCIEMYRRMREQGPDYKTYTGQVGASVYGYFGSWFPAPKPVHKVKKVFGSYVLSSYFASAFPEIDIKSFLAQLKLPEFVQSLGDKFSAQDKQELLKMPLPEIENVVTSGELGKLLEKAWSLSCDYKPKFTL